MHSTALKTDQPLSCKPGRFVLRRAQLALASALLLVSSGCDSIGPDTRTFPEPRLYTHDFFDSIEECTAAQPDPDFWINCAQTLSLCPSGRAEYMVTDIIHLGTYRIEEGSLVLSLPSDPELPSRVRFRISADESQLTELASGTIWTQKFGEELESVKHSCQA
jgi:hypothetical protein